jgi:hypothetical protein
MARVSLTPVIVPAASATNLTGVNLTAAAAAGVAPGGVGSGNGVQFTNFPGQTFLIVSVGLTATTPTVVIGATLYGQASTGIVMSALTVSALSLLGPFFSAGNLQGPGVAGLAAVDFSSVTTILCTALQLSGVS